MRNIDNYIASKKDYKLPLRICEVNENFPEHENRFKKLLAYELSRREDSWKR